MLLIGVGSTNILLACGDKFLVSSRSTRYQKPAVARTPSAILIWANPASELSKGLAGVAVDDTLRKVGYRPTTVATASEFDQALNRGGWDLVIVGAADAQAVSERLRSAGSPAVVPVALNPTTAQFQQVKKEYAVVLKAPAKRQSFLDAVDEALARRSKKIA